MSARPYRVARRARALFAALVIVFAAAGGPAGGAAPFATAAVGHGG